MAEVVILGSGAGFASLDRFNTSIAILSNQQVYLFDCGEPCGALLYRQGIDPLATRAIFISHMHPDHVGGLPQMLFSMYLPGRNPTRKFRPWSITRYDPWYVRNIRYPQPSPVPAEAPPRSKVSLHVPQEAVKPVRDYLPWVYLFPELLPFDLDIAAVRTGEFYNDGVVRVTAVANDHLRGNRSYHGLPSTYPGLNLESYCFVADVEGKRIVYSGDIDRTEEVAPLLDAADLFIIETAHVSPDDIVQLARQIRTPRIVLSHIHPGLEEWAARAVRESGDSRLAIAADGYRIAL